MSSRSTPNVSRKRTQLVALSPKKKQTVDAAPFKWSCVVCFEELGEKGVVPVVLRDCFPNAHTLCLACARLMNTNKEGGVLRVKCPMCQGEACDVAVLSDFVDETSDALARARIESVKYTPADYATQKIIAIARADAFVAQESARRLHNERLQLGVKLVKALIKSPLFDSGALCTVSPTAVPDFDKSRVRAATRGDADFEEKRVAAVRVAKEVLVDMRRVYKDTMFAIGMDPRQTAIVDGVETVAYLRLHVYLRESTNR